MSLSTQFTHTVYSRAANGNFSRGLASWRCPGGTHGHRLSVDELHPPIDGPVYYARVPALTRLTQDLATGDLGFWAPPKATTDAQGIELIPVSKTSYVLMARKGELNLSAADVFKMGTVRTARYELQGDGSYLLFTDITPSWATTPFPAPSGAMTRGVTNGGVPAKILAVFDDSTVTGGDEGWTIKGTVTAYNGEVTLSDGAKAHSWTLSSPTADLGTPTSGIGASGLIEDVFPESGDILTVVDRLREVSGNYQLNDVQLSTFDVVPISGFTSADTVYAFQVLPSARGEVPSYGSGQTSGKAVISGGVARLTVVPETAREFGDDPTDPLPGDVFLTDDYAGHVVAIAYDGDDILLTLSESTLPYANPLPPDGTYIDWQISKRVYGSGVYGLPVFRYQATLSLNEIGDGHDIGVDLIWYDPLGQPIGYVKGEQIAESTVGLKRYLFEIEDVTRSPFQGTPQIRIRNKSGSETVDVSHITLVRGEVEADDFDLIRSDASAVAAETSSVTPGTMILYGNGPVCPPGFKPVCRPAPIDGALTGAVNLKPPIEASPLPPVPPLFDDGTGATYSDVVFDAESASGVLTVTKSAFPWRDWVWGFPRCDAPKVRGGMVLLAIPPGQTGQLSLPYRAWMIFDAAGFLLPYPTLDGSVPLPPSEALLVIRLTGSAAAGEVDSLKAAGYAFFVISGTYLINAVEGKEGAVFPGSREHVHTLLPSSDGSFEITVKDAQLDSGLDTKAGFPLNLLKSHYHPNTGMPQNVMPRGKAYVICERL